MQDAAPFCPRCGDRQVVRTGHTRTGSGGLLCRGYGRSFVPAPKRRPITPDREELIRKLLVERVSLRGIARSTGVSRPGFGGRG